MLLKTKGHPHNIIDPIVGRVTRDVNSHVSDSILITGTPTALSSTNFLAEITSHTVAEPFSVPTVTNVASFDHLSEGDLISISPNGTINTLYRVNSHYNFLLVTERCNSNCLMCSQPPKNRDDIPYLFNLYQKLIPLIPKDCREIGITGGEPTLMGDLYFDFLRMIKDELPNTEIHCLSNGRSFAWKKTSEKLAELNLNRLMLGIPLYSDYYKIHDYIVQAPNAFNQTIQGLYNLALNNQRIEIRIVLHKQSIPRLVKLAKFIYMNLPFVEHIAFMGLENTGYTPYNIDKLWIDPIDYMGELEKAVEYLAVNGMNVSIYNSQLCLMPEVLWKYSRKSISDWKNIYLNECTNCELLDKCGGLFASCENMHSKYIKAK